MVSNILPAVTGQRKFLRKFKTDHQNLCNLHKKNFLPGYGMGSWEKLKLPCVHK